MLKLKNLPVKDNPSHSVLIHGGDAGLCKTVSDKVLSGYGLYIQPINCATVPKTGILRERRGSGEGFRPPQHRRSFVVWVAVKTGWHLTEGAVGEGFKWALFVLLAAGTVFVGPFGIAVPFQRRLKEKTGEVGEGEREVELARLLEILEADIPLQVSHVMSQRPDNLPRS
uniref:Uncharacterized protein n=1 Tax=Chromera velia CCMP2878 TaxID=1169474 RepID=A0A0G4G1E6_9ALVE|eukprot:Cvel_4049.t1-p1 / transcript=Cvel_4049.t1 / gene=Cvel_4049 / organism=Chromera_velia_CCMP2878 / gene_product=5-aminolevulinate synthase, putative / transcript_product=5-aminolevulinate synthase, putative / location=Cvel_scaffold172:60256-63748(+) / protein_length=169 / sequence_SO=supercontig / SO=protein_coding / is_pseudo=false